MIFLNKPILYVGFWTKPFCDLKNTCTCILQPECRESTKLLVYLVNYCASAEFNYFRNRSWRLVKYISTTKRQNFVLVTTFTKFPFILFRKRYYLLRNKSWPTGAGVILSSNLSEYIRDERAYFNGVLLVFYYDIMPREPSNTICEHIEGSRRVSHEHTIKRFVLFQQEKFLARGKSADYLLPNFPYTS